VATKRAAKRVLDPGVEPTFVASISEGAVADAMEKLQIRHYTGEMTQRMAFAAIVAIVKHLERNGSTST
jgi:hypothetical protein